MGRWGVSPRMRRLMATASKSPIQMGRMRFPSFSFRTMTWDSWVSEMMMRLSSTSTMRGILALRGRGCASAAGLVAPAGQDREGRVGRQIPSRFAAHEYRAPSVPQGPRMPAAGAEARRRRHGSC